MGYSKLFLSFIICLCVIQTSFTATCGASCQACDSTTGVCLPYSCKFGYYLSGSTCTAATSDSSAALMTDGSDTMANCEGFNRRQAASSTTCVASTNSCSSSCTDAGCIWSAAGAEYCFACKTAWPSTPGTIANMLTNDGSNGYLWVLASSCTGNAAVTSSMTSSCSQFAGVSYCTLCKDGYIAQRTSSSSSTCISRSLNTAYLDPAQLQYCIMVDASNNCLSCDIFKDTTMTTNAACAVPSNPGIVGRLTWPMNSSNVWHYRQSSHTGMYQFPDVFIGSKFGSAPSTAQQIGNGADIYAKTTADYNSLESYSLGSDYPYLHASTSSSGVNFIYTFGYGYYVEESYISYRTPGHTFGSLTTWNAGSANWACPLSPEDNVSCSGQAVSTSTACSSVLSAIPVQPHCECNTGYAGLACEETITKTFTNDFSYSQKSTAQFQKYIFQTTRNDMNNYGFTDIYSKVPDYTIKGGGQAVMAQVRSQFVYGRYDKQNWLDNVWTGNSYLPGFQPKYWNGTKTLGSETRRRRVRILARLFMAENYSMVTGLNKNAFSGMATNMNLYFTMIRLYEKDISMGAEVLVRGMPLALKIIIPIFTVGAIAIIILIAWCLVPGDEGEKEEGGAEESKDKKPEEQKNLVSNEKSSQNNNKVGHEESPIKTRPPVVIEEEKIVIESTVEKDRDAATKSRPTTIQEQPVQNVESHKSNNFIVEEDDNGIDTEKVQVVKQPESFNDDDIQFGLAKDTGVKDDFEDEDLEEA